MFFNRPLILFDDLKHSGNEKRWYLLGKTDLNRPLFIVFTIRKNLIRIISARNMNKKKERYTMSKLKEIPKFKNEEEEREFWAVHDSTEYIDWSKSNKAIFPNLKPSTKTISLRLPESLIDELKRIANKRDVPYQSLIKIILRDKIEEEIRNNA
ncbi:MAG: BrnT family toxin [Ignavibacteriales bacterium]|nr:BrnT family toxin [Ignavibacteriales bacterium]